MAFVEPLIGCTRTLELSDRSLSTDGSAGSPPPEDGARRQVTDCQRADSPVLAEGGGRRADSPALAEGGGRRADSSVILAEGGGRREDSPVILAEGGGRRAESPVPAEGGGRRADSPLLAAWSRQPQTAEHPPAESDSAVSSQPQLDCYILDDENEPPPDLEEHNSGGGCAVCGLPASGRCSACRAALYCGPVHQQQHWPAHRPLCRPYAVALHPLLGRHLVATRPLRRGDLILRDAPLMVGPCADTAPLCLGCYRPVAGPRRCRRCGWPLCSEPCEQSEQHRAECDLTAGSPLGALSGHEGVDWYPCVAVLRLLRLRDTRPADWARLLQLQSHDDERRDTDTYQLEQTTVVDRVRHRFGQFQHSELLLHRICGIMETNAYEIRLPEINVQGVYARAALFEHDCVPNTHRTFDENLTLVVRAAVDIAQGEHLTSIYTDNLWGTWQRREHLLTSKHFLCECARCCDPTELGTGLSSIRCSLCQHGYIQSVDPLQAQADFRCAACGALVPGAPVRSALAALEAEVQAVEEEPTIDDCERLIQICSSVLHPTHHLMLDLKYPLVHLYNTSEPLPAAQLNRKEQLCKEILSVADIVTPGISRLQGIVRYELQQTLLQKARFLYDVESHQSADVIALFREARDVLCAAISVLRWEPCVQPEGQLGLEAADELTELDAWLREHLPAAAAPAEPVQGDGADSETPTGRRTGPPADTGEQRRGAETGPDCPAQRGTGLPESHTVSCAEQAPVPRRAPTQLRA